MTISELIAKLQELRAEHGDLSVWAQGLDDGAYEVEGVNMFRSLQAVERSDAVLLTEFEIVKGIE